jgi:hypothetical protein
LLTRELQNCAEYDWRSYRNWLVPSADQLITPRAGETILYMKLWCANFKGQCHETFDPLGFSHQMNHNAGLKQFRIWLRIHPDNSCQNLLPRSQTSLCKFFWKWTSTFIWLIWNGYLEYLGEFEAIYSLSP